MGETAEMKIEIFTSETCSRCILLERALNDRNIPYNKYDTGTPEGLAELAYRESAEGTLPILFIDGERVRDVMTFIKGLEEGAEHTAEKVIENENKKD